MNDLMKKSIVFGICFFFGFSLLEFIATGDFDFFIEFFWIKVVAAIVVAFIAYYRLGGKPADTSSSTERNRRNSESEYERIQEDDEKEVGENKNTTRPELVGYYIGGSIKRPSDISRLKAEMIISPYLSMISRKSKEECKLYENSVCVMHLNSIIHGEAKIDVHWEFDDKSLFQKPDGRFFILYNSCAPYAGCVEVTDEFEMNYFETHTVDEFLSLARLRDVPGDVEKLFERRELSFFAERWCSYDYRVLFHWYGYGSHHDRDSIIESVEKYKEKFSGCVDEDTIISHIENESEKAIEIIENGGVLEDHFDLDLYEYNPCVAKYRY